MSKVPEFGAKNGNKIKEWFRRHENLFGTEFEERYDPYMIFIKIVSLSSDDM